MIECITLYIFMLQRGGERERERERERESEFVA